MTDDTDDTADGSGRTSTRRGFLAGAGAVGVAAVGLPAAGALQQSGMRTRSFDVRIENVSRSTTLQTTAMGAASEQPVPLSPGAYAVHTPDEPIFTSGEPERDNGLEEIAEDGMPGTLAEHLAARETVTDSGAFARPIGADRPAPLGPGDTYAFEVTASGPASYLSLVTMFVPSNDLFYALGGARGLRLFEEGDPVTGDVTDRVGLWDAGTEVNEEPGVGENQVQRQRGAGVGLVERGTVAPIEAVNGYDYPAVEDVIEVRLQ
jgi:hypothetical protein